MRCVCCVCRVMYGVLHAMCDVCGFVGGVCYVLCVACRGSFIVRYMWRDGLRGLRDVAGVLRFV